MLSLGEPTFYKNKKKYYIIVLWYWHDDQTNTSLFNYFLSKPLQLNFLGDEDIKRSLVD